MKCYVTFVFFGFLNKKPKSQKPKLTLGTTMMPLVRERIGL